MRSLRCIRHVSIGGAPGNANSKADLGWFIYADGRVGRSRNVDVHDRRGSAHVLRIAKIAGFTRANERAPVSVHAAADIGHVRGPRHARACGAQKPRLGRICWVRHDYFGWCSLLCTQPFGCCSLSSSLVALTVNIGNRSSTQARVGFLLSGASIADVV